MHTVLEHGENVDNPIPYLGRRNKIVNQPTTKEVFRHLDVGGERLATEHFYHPWTGEPNERSWHGKCEGPERSP